MDKSQMMVWKKIGYMAHDVVCMAANNGDVSRMRETAENIRNGIKYLDICDLEKMNSEQNIAITEYADLLAESVNTDDADMKSVRSKAEAIVQIVVDMSYGSLKSDEYYKGISEGSTYV